ncbi:hypothetical protein UZ36_07270 [Candidatus Nitromaritima sp. SCGC AAA799-C22]|nr:hypothetical protein UZ36_07270 [Candidatus Nitromaritima sp. SCGC AAA799-C22]
MIVELSLTLEFIQYKYGNLIFNYPTRIHGYSGDDAGDFYIYCFGEERIMKRLAGYRGDNEIQFKTYLSYYVLKSLFLDWLKTRKEVPTVSLDSPILNSAREPEGKSLAEIIPSPSTGPDKEFSQTQDRQKIEGWLNGLPPEKKVLLKLLTLGETDLSKEDVRTIAKISGRSIRETLSKIELAYEGINQQNEKLQRDREQVSIVSYRIRELEKEIFKLDEKLKSARHINDEGLIERRTTEQTELEKKLAWRREQRTELIKKVWSSSTGLPYRVIADVLNCPMGSVCSGIARLREQFQRELQDKENDG